jgi:hypothetical protein
MNVPALPGSAAPQKKSGEVAGICVRIPVNKRIEKAVRLYPRAAQQGRIPARVPAHGR